MLAAISIFRSSGVMDAILDSIRWITVSIGLTVTEWIDAMPVAFMKPLSGSGAKGALQELITHRGFSDLSARIATVMLV